MTNLCKRAKEWLKNNEKDLFLAVVIVLVAAISFGLGRLSKIREEKTPITLETNNLAANLILSAPKINISASTQPQDKIFVASKNGKKYYYAWCESAQKIKESNRIWFTTKEEAEKYGYEPAANCRGLK
ncbi:MAG: hypothetical protein L6Q29_04570 [Candidatus Pacebacteria bacterium]|nr:hypothetical protein [Candidatus Paceibacterota bacterium]